MAPWILAGLCLIALGALFGPQAWQRARRAQWRRRPFPATWREILRRRMPFFATLPADLQLQLKGHVQVLVAEKPFVGCGGLKVTEEMRVLVAAQAALLLLNRPTAYFPNLREILVYPGAFVVQRDEHDGAGLVRQDRRVLSGESWQRGQVILSWDDVLAGAAAPADGRNVVIHEFAHQLDQQSGQANGAPFLGRRDRYAAWSATLGTAFAQLRHRLAHGEPTPIDPYGATAPAEFFAVVSELFFERPGALAQAEPALYQAFVGYYQVDPLSW